MNPGQLSRRVLPWLATLSALAVSQPGRSDPASPWIAPFPGSQLADQSVKAREAYWMPLGKLYGSGQADKFETIEGRWSHFAYANPAGHTVIEIFDAYQDSLAGRGFQIAYSCKDDECGQGGRATNNDWWDPTERRRFLVAKLTRAEGDVWVSVNVHEKPPKVAGRHDIDVIEVAPNPHAAESEEESAAAKGDLFAQINRLGHAPLYGVAWDARGGPTAASATALQKIVDLLVAHPKLQLYLVVHTDNVGGVQVNVDRSRREATALANLLVKKYGVSATRIRPSGMGPLAPVASNDSEDGRARNRRVELVRP